jgi:hypothetical protein
MKRVLDWTAEGYPPIEKLTAEAMGRKRNARPYPQGVVV